MSDNSTTDACCPVFYICLETLKDMKRQFYTDAQIVHLDIDDYQWNRRSKKWEESGSAYDKRMLTATDDACRAAGLDPNCTVCGDFKKDGPCTQQSPPATTPPQGEKGEG